MKNNTLSLLSYIDFSLWQEAKKLLDFQVNQMDKNKHYLTLSMFYYKRISHLTNIVNTQEYFDKRVANALFYALEREFAFYDYVVPKSYLGLRNQKFITYPLRVLYYSIGLYLLKLSQDFLQTYAAKNKRLKCYYGGNLLFNQNSLTVKHETTFYKNYYKDFKKQIRKQITNDSDNKLVIKLDIENFFDNISIPTLLDNLDKYVKPSIKEELSFTTSTKENLTFFYSYLSHNQGGIPQADNDIISSFIGYLYLTFSDLLIDSEIFTYKEFINEHTIIRYVDDIFIVVNFCNEAAQLQREKIIYSLTSQISDLLYSHLKVKLNKKTKLYWLGNKSDRETILKDLKKVSPEYHLNDEENDETPENKLVNIFHELQKLKNSSIDFSIYSDGTIEADILREIYEKSVNQLLAKEENIAQIEAIFNDFNFDLVNVMPREIILIISKSKKVLQEFVHFLDSKMKLSTRDAYLILTLLCQHEFQYTNLFGRIKTIDSFKHIFNAFEEISIFSEKPGYFQLSYEEVVLITQYSNVIEQTRLRMFNEKINSYSVGLNHLLNEIHAVCMCFDKINQKTKYEADDVVNYLTSKYIPHEICISIRNLFDRRNRNTVSHPSISDKIAWGVTKEEYTEYREVVGKCLKLILSIP